MAEFTTVAYSWQHGQSFVSGLLFFAVTDYDESPEVFTDVCTCSVMFSVDGKCSLKPVSPRKMSPHLVSWWHSIKLISLE